MTIDFVNKELLWNYKFQYLPRPTDLTAPIYQYSEDGSHWLNKGVVCYGRNAFFGHLRLTGKTGYAG